MTKLVALVVLLALVERPVAQAPVWGQCGGLGWTGPVLPTQPVPTYTSTALSVYQILPGSAIPNYPDIYTYGPTAIFTSELGQITPLDYLGWYISESSPSKFNWGLPDLLVNWTTSNGQLIRGHSLLGQTQIPPWVASISTDAAALTSAIKNHISNVAGRYSGKIYGWDVVNNILNDAGSYQPNIFYNALGEDFVKVAFQAARAADPNAKLYISDFGLDSDNAKVQGIIRVVNSLNSGGARLIDGIGTEVKLGAGQAGGVQAALTALAETGLEIAITGLDIDGASPDDYSTVVKACLAVPECIGITTADISDAFPTLPHLLFDYSLQPTPAYYAVLDALA